MSSITTQERKVIIDIAKYINDTPMILFVSIKKSAVASMIAMAVSSDFL